MTAQQGDSPCLETSDEISISSPEKKLVTANAFFTLEKLHRAENGGEQDNWTGRTGQEKVFGKERKH